MARAMRPLPSSKGWLVTNHRWATPAFSTGSGAAVSNQFRKAPISESSRSAAGAS